LDIPQQIQYKVGVMVYQCLQGRAPQYLTDCCTLMSDIASHQHLRSATRHQLNVPRHYCITASVRIHIVHMLATCTAGL